MEINFELTPFGWYAELYYMGQLKYQTPDQGKDSEPTYFSSFMDCAEDINKVIQSDRAGFLKKVIP
jgi:hypothetical protein